MAAVSEIHSKFVIDTKPFEEGLRRIMGLTDQTGKSLSALPTAINKGFQESTKSIKSADDSINSLKSRISELTSKMESVSVSSKRFEVLKNAVEEAKKKLSELNDTSAKTGQTLTDKASSLTQAMTAVGAGLGFAGIVSGFKSLADASQQAESQIKGLSAVVGNRLGGEAVPKAVDMVTNLSKELGLNKGAITEATKNLVSMNFTLEQTEQLLRGATDIAIDNKQSQYDTSEAVKVWTEGLKNNNSVLSDSIGISENISAQYKRLGVDGDVLGKKTEGQAARQKVVNDFMAQFSVFSGRAAEAMTGYSGALSVANSATSEIQISLGNIVREAATPLIQMFAVMSAKVSEFLQNLSPFAKDMIGAAGTFVLAASGAMALASAIPLVTKGFQAMAAAGAFNPIVLALIAIATIILLIIKNWDKLKSQFSGMLQIVESLKTTFMEMIQPLIDGLAPLEEFFQAFADGASDIDYVATLLATMLQPFIIAIEYTLGGLQLLFDMIQGIGILVSGLTGILVGIFTLDIDKIMSEWDSLGSKLDAWGLQIAQTIEDTLMRMWKRVMAVFSGETIIKVSAQEEKKEEKPKAAVSPSINKADLKEEQRVVEEWFKSNPALAKVAFDYKNLPIDILKKQLSEIMQSPENAQRIKLDFDIRDIRDVKLPQMLKTFEGISSQLGIPVNKLINFKPEDLSKLRSQLKYTIEKAGRESIDTLDVTGKPAKLYFDIETAIDKDVLNKKIKESTDEISHNFEQAANQTGPLNEFEQTTKKFAEQYSRLKENIASGDIGGSIAAGAKMAAESIQDLGGKLVQFLNASSQLAQVKLENLKQKYAMYNKGLEEIEKAQLEKTLAAIDAEQGAKINALNSELESIQAQKAAIEEEENRHQAELNAIKSQYAQDRKAQLDQEYMDQVAIMQAEYDAKLATMQQEIGDTDEFNVQKAVLAQSLEENKAELNKQYQERLQTDIANHNATLDAQEDQRTAQNQAKKDALDVKQKAADEQKAALQKKMEDDKAAATEASENRKQEAKRLTAFIEYRAGFATFQAEQRSKMASVQITLATTLLNAIAGIATMTAMAGPVGLVAGIAMSAMITGLAVAAAATSMAAIQSQKYPPFLAFNEGGIVPGTGNTDTVPAMLTPGELIIDKATTSDILSAKNNGGAMGRNVNIGSLVLQNTFMPRDDAQMIMNTIENNILEKLRSAIPAV